MKDQQKTKARLISELAELRQRVAEKEIENKLARQERYFRSLMLSLHEDITVIDRDYLITEVNDSALRTLGKKREDVIGNYCYEVSHGHVSPCDEHGEQCALRAVFETGEPQSYLHEHIISKRGKTHLDIMTSPLKDEDGNVTHVIEAARDVSDLFHTQAALEESESLLRQIAENYPNSFVSIIEDDFTVGFMSGQESQKSGFNLRNFLGSNVDQAFGDHADIVREHCEKTFRGEECSFELTAKGQFQHYRTVPLYSEDGFVFRILVVVEDITDRRRSEEEKAALEAQLRHAQKMETIGTLAGGIAHDFNNILAPILGYTDMALHRLEPKDPLVEDLRNVLNAAHRAKALVQQILLFSKQTENERKPLRLQGIVTDALKLLRPTIPTTVDIQWHADDSCGSVLADTTQMHQVVVNLCTNAWQSMWENGGGTVTIELAQTSVNADTARLHPDLTEQEYACLSVKDSGCGMDEEIRARIFEPFFTTKAIDEGTGLGLSVVHGIVRSHNGAILLDSELGKGTTIRVYLPTVSAELEVSKRESKAFVGGRESIMVVDDEPSIANLLRMMLGSCGYEVDAYTSSVEALQAFRRQPDKYDLLISDLTMPNMTGLELSDQVHEGHPELPVMIMTGFGDGLKVDTQKKYGIKQVVKKPAMLADLAAAVREILDG